MSKTLKIFGAVAALAVVIVMVASLSVNVITLNKVNTIVEKDENADRENGVLIADEYEVKSTAQISDAYISGDSSSLEDADREALKLASDILDKLIKDKMTDYEKEVAVYKWMIKNISHDDGMLTVIRSTAAGSDAPQGVLKSKTAVCVGYATTFRLFMQMLGIDCHVVHDKDLGHTWNLVNIGDGWYHTDLFFDSPGPEFGHFNMTDAMRQNDYDWDTRLFPHATDLEYCYVIKSAEKCSDIYSVPKKLRKMIDKKESVLSLRFSDLSDEEKSALNSMLLNIQTRISETEEYIDNYVSWHAIEDGKDYVFYVTIEYPVREATNIPLSDKTQQKVDSAVEKAFSDLTPAEDTSYNEIQDEKENGEAENAYAR